MSNDPAPARRAKVFHSKALEGIDLEVIDWSAVETTSIEEMAARSRRPSARLRRLVRAPRFAWERHVERRRADRMRRERGWSPAELWNLDAHLCAHLGAMLAIHAEEARNHPPELEHDEWRGQLRWASEALLGYDPEDGGRVAEARSALRWAADNLVDLWD